MYLAEVAEFLLAQGHTRALQYVLKQAISLYVLADKRGRAETIEQMGVVRAAYHADDKTYKKLIKSLS